MRLNILILVLVVVAGFLLTFWLDESAPQPAPLREEKSVFETESLTTIPAFTLTDLEGTPHKITDYKGKIVLLSFWASWCAPCVVEFPKLVTLASERNKDIVLIALSSDVGEGQIKRFLDKQTPEIKTLLESPNIIVAKDKNSEITGTIFQTYKLPETIIIDRSGKMIKKIVGDTDWAGDEIKTLLSAL